MTALDRSPREHALAPPLKWAGGKRWLVPRLARLWRGHEQRRLVEPFAGGLAVALGLRPAAALLNDVNPHLINFYTWLRSGLVISQIDMQNDEQVYYTNRRRFNEVIRERMHSQEAAELFYYLNRTGYNGLCRFNQRGRYNVPFGQHKRIHYLRDLRPYAALLGKWQFTARDFGAIETGADDFVYADPPYDVEFTAYCARRFGWPEQVRLAHWLAAHRGPVVASNQATKRILELYADLGFEITLLNAPRRISCTGDRAPAREMLATRGMERGM